MKAMSRKGWLLALMLSAVLKMSAWRSVDNAALSESERIRLADYEVSVKTGSGEWRKVKVEGALVSNIDRREENWGDTLGHKRTLMGFAMFTDPFRKAVKVRIRRQGEVFRAVEVRPTALGIRSRRVDERTVELTLHSPKEKVSVEFDGDRDHNLFIIPDLPEEKPTEAEGRRVIYYGQGEHEVGEIRLESGDLLYVDEGATVYGRITARNAQNIGVRGRGIICGSRSVHDMKRRQTMIHFQGCSQIEVSGVMFRGSPSWTLAFYGCTGLRMDNVKQICWMVNSDGMDLCNTRDVSIKDCFQRNYDDNISLKNFDGSQSTENVDMQDCTLWADCAHNLLVGPETRAHLEMKNVSFRNIQILEGRETAYPYRGAMAVMCSDDGRFSNIGFQNITLDHVRGAQIFAVEFCTYVRMGVGLRNVSLRKVNYLGSDAQLPKSTVKGLDRDHRVENFHLQDLRVNGRKVTPKNAAHYLETNEFVSQLQVNGKNVEALNH